MFIWGMANVIKFSYLFSAFPVLQFLLRCLPYENKVSHEGLPQGK